jgi:hypothetical protein
LGESVLPAWLVWGGAIYASDACHHKISMGRQAGWDGKAIA